MGIVLYRSLFNLYNIKSVLFLNNLFKKSDYEICINSYQ